MNKPDIIETKEFGKLVRVSAFAGFREWLSGQTVPLVENDDDPYDWAYYHDYLRFQARLPVID